MQSIIEKYLYAVVKHLDIKKREDVKKELNSLVWDMLEERTAGMEVQESDVILLVLNDLVKKCNSYWRGCVA